MSNKTKPSQPLLSSKRPRPRQADDALIYLKLRQNNCSSKKALIFTSRKQHKVFYRTDATILKDGPASCRALTPSVEKESVHAVISLVMKGWMINSKLRYKNAMCPSQEISMNQTKERRGIAKLITDERRRVESAKKEYDQYLGEMDFVGGEKQINLQKIKECIRRYRGNREEVVECQGVRMSETSSILVKEEAMKKSHSLISKLGAFDSERQKPGTEQRKRSISRLVTPRVPTQRKSCIQTGLPVVNPEQFMKKSDTPRLHPRSQLINFGTTELEDNDFYFSLEGVIKNMPPVPTQSSVQLYQSRSSEQKQ